MKAFCMIILVLAVTAISATNIGSDEVDTNNRPGPKRDRVGFYTTRFGRSDPAWRLRRSGKHGQELSRMFLVRPTKKSIEDYNYGDSDPSHIKCTPPSYHGGSSGSQICMICEQIGVDETT
jgi:hypothetical protein